ncbi:MAG TPA: enoyl-CoA hydratase/isomerase family protein [Puia sp.]|nr:enoyl-CoA hydratase/isomerase family protein [Puia sp.]
MQSFETIEYTVTAGIATLTFNRPDQLNAMNRRMMDEIIAALQAIIQDKHIDVAVITGKGRAFMAGADIKEYAAQTNDQFVRFQRQGRQLYSLIETAEIPFIAAVNGYALGGGFEIALACDFIVAAVSASMGLPEIHLGLIPGGGGAQRLLQKVGVNRTKEMLLLGGSYPAAQLHHWGIVYDTPAGEDLPATVLALAQKLQRRPRISTKAIKAMLTPAAIGLPFETRLDQEGEAVIELFNHPVAQDLIKKFTEKNSK